VKDTGERRATETGKRRSEEGRWKRAALYLAGGLSYFIITGATRELLEEEVKPLVERFMGERGLTLSAQKTLITHINDGFDFLGQHVRKYAGKALTKPARTRMLAFLQKVRGIIKASKQATAGKLITRLNPLIRGWTRYHCHAASKDAFRTVDHEIVKALWQWAKRRHPTKGRRWVKDKYFPPMKNQHWVFQGEILIGKRKEKRHVRLFQAMSVPIQRHIKIRSDANPYDPDWELYFEQRYATQTRDALKGRGMTLSLWMEQQGICPVCHQLLTHETGWHNHHIVWRSLGGGDEQRNRILVHPTCHEQIHSQRLSVTKPRPATGVRKA
jgi:RNA-directed DNA polymerase